MGKKKIDWDALEADSNDEEQGKRPVRRKPAVGNAVPAAWPGAGSTASIMKTASGGSGGGEGDARVPGAVPEPGKISATDAAAVANRWQTFGVREAQRREKENALLPADYPVRDANALSFASSGIGAGNLHRIRGTSSFRPANFDALVARQRSNPSINRGIGKHKVGATKSRVKLMASGSSRSASSTKLRQPPQSRVAGTTSSSSAAAAASGKQTSSFRFGAGSKSPSTAGPASSTNPFTGRQLATANDLVQYLNKHSSSSVSSGNLHTPGTPAAKAASSAVSNNARPTTGSMLSSSRMQPRTPATGTPSRPRLATSDDIANLKKAVADVGKPSTPSGNLFNELPRKNKMEEEWRLKAESAGRFLEAKKREILEFEEQVQKLRVNLSNKERELAEARTEIRELQTEIRNLRTRESDRQRAVEEALRQRDREWERRESAWREKEQEWSEAIARATDAIASAIAKRPYTSTASDLSARALSVPAQGNNGAGLQQIPESTDFSAGQSAIADREPARVQWLPPYLQNVNKTERGPKTFTMRIKRPYPEPQEVFVFRENDDINRFIDHYAAERGLAISDTLRLKKTAFEKKSALTN